MTKEVKWIYESPNGGKTVTRRPMGADISTREICYEDPEHMTEKKFHERWHKFRDILELAKQNPTMEKMLNQVEMYYELSK